MNEPQNNQSLPVYEPQTSPAESSGWSWGAFMLDPAFLLGLKKYKYLFWYILTIIPIAGPIF